MAYGDERRGGFGGGGGGRGPPGGPRESHPAKCSTCGKEFTVPFKPTEGRPVYCQEHYQPKGPRRF